MIPLFESESLPPFRERLEEDAVLLHGFARGEAAFLVEEAERIARLAAFRRLVTPVGHVMSVAMTNCGRVGWVSDLSGYRSDSIDPDTGKRCPAMTAAFTDVAVSTAAESAIANYDP